MDKNLLSVILACLFLLASSEKVFEWSVHEYPDPFSYDTYSECGRPKKSNICDPNNILAPETANEIDALIEEVLDKTRCGCSSCIDNKHGYVIRVAIMPRMQSILKKGNSTLELLKDAQMFAYMLTQKWAMAGDCEESLLILFSQFDGILYTLTLPHTREVLTDSTVKRITLSVRPLFDNTDTVGRGLMDMIGRYKLVFDGKQDEALRPRMAAQRGSGASGFGPSLFLSLLLSSVFLVIIH